LSRPEGPDSAGSTKSEARSTKEIRSTQNGEIQNRGTPNWCVSSFRHFFFRPWSLFRASSFGFRASPRLEEAPEQFPIFYRGFRRAITERFPYNIFFRIEGDAVIVFRILHAARDHTWRLR
jgi:hypothetical protein